VNQVAKKYGASALPGVNLVPNEIAERRKMRSVRLMAIVAVLIAIGAVVVVYLGAVGTRVAAQSGLNDALNQQDAAIEQRDALAPVYAAYVEREIDEYALSQAGWGEIDLSQFIVAVANEASSDAASFTSIQFLGPSAVGTGGDTQDAVFASSIGTITFSAIAESPQEATALIARLEALPGLASVRATGGGFEGNEGEVFWHFDGVATVTPAVLTMRLIPQDSIIGLTPESIEAAVRAASGQEVAPAPAPVPSPSPTAQAEG